MIPNMERTTLSECDLIGHLWVLSCDASQLVEKSQENDKMRAILENPDLASHVVMHMYLYIYILISQPLEQKNTV